MSVEPDSDASRPDPADELITDETAMPFRVLVATLVVAQRTGLPVYSDDRVVRLLARHAGLPAFGTLGLLDALAKRGPLTAERVADARRQLRTEGFHGITPTASELAALLAASGGEPSGDIHAAFYDPAPWKASYGASLALSVDFLRGVFAEFPEKFEEWVRWLLGAVLDRAALSRRLTLEVVKQHEALLFHAQWLLAGAWMSAPNSSAQGRPFLCALRPALDAAMRALGTDKDPLAGAFGIFQASMAEATAGRVTGVPLSLLVQMPMHDQMLLLGVDSTARDPFPMPSLRGPSRLELAARRVNWAAVLRRH